MTHDFAKAPKATKKKTASKKKAAPKRQVPGWVWLFTGIAVGVFISFLGFLADITPDSATEQADKPAAASKKAKREEKDTGTRFDFYTLLPELEVIVPDETPTQRKPAKATTYILQAGSFKHATDADRLRAKLILWGLDAKVEAAKVANGDIWHRVLVGPFKDRSRLSKARSILIENGINSLLYTLKED